ncbi:glutamate carboxypeptidase [Neisseriaceae bacterium TC5R-5]|nr:glutamate carboxypeptidase [Neisseriaceae bacterium TC5R-5]
MRRVLFPLFLPRHTLLTALFVSTLLSSGLPQAAEMDAEVKRLASQQKQPLIDSLQQLVSIESGSRDLEGLAQISQLIAQRFVQLGAQVDIITPGSSASPEVRRNQDTPQQLGKMVKATFQGSGNKNILLIAHMDTVYPRGMLAQYPFRIEDNKAYGLGVSDDKHGIALILHSLAMLKQLNFNEYGTLTVLINADEELGSPGSQAMLARLGQQHDVVLSHESSLATAQDKLTLATAGIAMAALEVEGRASHAGAAPEKGVNALYEMAHQVMQMRDFSDPAKGIKVNWTLAKAGEVRNVIPAKATASADIRVERISDYEVIEQRLRDKVTQQLLPESKVNLQFERRRPPLEAKPAAIALAQHAQTIYDEIGHSLQADAKVGGGGTDAAFAAMNTQAPVLEGLGLRGAGSHTASAEYVLLDSIEPRLYLLTRMIMDVSRGKASAL